MRTDSLLPRFTGVDSHLLPVSRQSSPDAAFVARPRLVRLCDALHKVGRALQAKPVSRWRQAPVFFFHPSRQAELTAARSYLGARPTNTPPDQLVAVAAQIAMELPELFRSVEVRRVARGIAGLREAAAALATHLPSARDLADLLGVPDDETVLVLHPGQRLGYRMLVRGVADINQFHLLLMGVVTGDPADGLLPGPPLPARFLSAAQEADAITPAGVPMVAEARFQLFKPSAVQPDGSVPPGFRGCDHWLWGTAPLAAIPRVDGERALLIGDPAYRATWDIERRFPAMPAIARLLRVLGPFEVAERLGRLAGQPVPVRVADKPTVALTKAA